MHNHYDTLGVARDASTDEIKQAYRRKCSEYHPDRGGNPELMVAVNVAYETLSDPDRRAHYDETSNEPLNRVRQLFDKYLQDENADVRGDLIGLFVARVQDAINQLKGLVAKDERQIKRLERQMHRVQGQNGLFQKLAKDRIEIAKRQIAEAQEEISINQQVIKLLTQCTDTAPPRDAHSYTQQQPWMAVPHF